jgi:hypothetical protein
MPSESCYELPNIVRGDDISSLTLLWDRIRYYASLIENPSWHPLELVAVTYGGKLELRANDLPTLWARVDTYLSNRFELTYVYTEQAYCDLAYEDLPVNAEGEPVVLVRRNSCNAADVKTLGVASTAQYFGWAGTRDAGSVRAAPVAHSPVRAGGLAYIQGYNLVKDLFASPDRSSPPLFSQYDELRLLAFSEETLRQTYQTSKSTIKGDLRRRRLYQVLCESIQHVFTSLQSFEDQERATFGGRQEVRVLLKVLQNLATPTSTLQSDQQHVENALTLAYTPADSAQSELASETGRLATRPNTQDNNKHWPYYALRKVDFIAFLSWQANRWLYGICGTLSLRVNRSVSTHLSAEDALLKEHNQSAVLAVFLTCLDVTLNSGCVEIHNRNARDRYERRQGRGLTAQGVDSVATDSGSSLDRSGDEEETGARTNRVRRGLNMLGSLNRYNMIWLPADLFVWPELLFVPNELARTAFVSTFFRGKYKHSARLNRDARFRRFVQTQIEKLQNASETGLEAREACEALSNACFFRYSQWLLERLVTLGYLDPGRYYRKEGDADFCSPAERVGAYGLSWSLIKRLGGDLPPVLSWCRGLGGTAARSAGRSGKGAGFSAFDNTWRTRVQLLFDWGDGFERGTWEEHEFRQWPKYIYQQLVAHCLVQVANVWRRGLGEAAGAWIKLLPKYEAGKLWMIDKDKNKLPVIRWIAMRPSRWRDYAPGMCSKYQDAGWEMLIEQSGQRTTDDFEQIYRFNPELLTGTVQFRFIEDLIEGEIVDQEARDAASDRAMFALHQLALSDEQIQ